jgi:type IV pilus assembly protein PilB
MANNRSTKNRGEKKDIEAPDKERVRAMIEDAKKASSEEGATDVLDALLLFAEHARASDIHLEPQEKISIVRLRIDGILHDVFEMPQSLHRRLVAVLKIRTRMRTDEHRTPQDGRFAFYTNEGKVDVRASVMPTTDGEKAVLRLLSSESHQLSLEELGLEDEDLARVQRAAKKPWGMILATGPTGSGKTTTIYAILEILNQRGINIATVEDPVEYYIPGVNQSQVDTDGQERVSFANGLRALLRQDPDVLMVGEVRDEETAKIAVNAALTGHKLLSTLHTNNASTTIPRLLDMGVEPFLVASTLNVAIAQRLLRRVCPDCVGEKTLTRKEASDFLDDDWLKVLFGDDKEISIATANQCKNCGESGYRGRIGIYEVLEVTEKIKTMIIREASSSEIEAQAMQEGMTPLTEDGLRKVRDGDTTLEEFLRVMQE